MKKILAFVCAFFAVSMFAATVSIAVAPAAQSLDNAARAQYLQYFTARFYHAAKISGLKPFSATEKQALEAAAARFADSSFQVFQKNDLLPVITKIESDPQIAKIMGKMLSSKDTEAFLAAARELGDYVHENYPDMHKSEFAADMAGCKQQFIKDVESIPSMPKLAEKSIFVFWNTVLTPGIR